MIKCALDQFNSAANVFTTVSLLFLKDQGQVNMKWKLNLAGAFFVCFLFISSDTNDANVKELTTAAAWGVGPVSSTHLLPWLCCISMRVKILWMTTAETPWAHREMPVTMVSINMGS